MPAVVNRWHLVLSKNFLLDRNAMLSAEHGACVTSSVITILPWLVSRVISRVPLWGTVVSGGGPVLTSVLLIGFCASPLSAGFVVHVHFAGARVPPADGFPFPPVVATTMPTTAPMTASTATPTRISLRRRRRRVACSRRTAISRS